MTPPTIARAAITCVCMGCSVVFASHRTYFGAGAGVPVVPVEPVGAGGGGGVGRHYELQVQCRGEPDPTTGYLTDIKEIDHAVRSAVLPLLQHACDTNPTAEPAQLLPDLLHALSAALPAARGLRWWLTPYY